VVIETTMPGRVWALRCLLMYSARAAAAHCEVEEKLPALSEDPAQQTGHGENEMTVRDGREDLVLQPFGPEELLLLLA
jgi:hypothetical protein